MKPNTLILTTDQNDSLFAKKYPDCKTRLDTSRASLPKTYSALYVTYGAKPIPYVLKQTERNSIEINYERSSLHTKP